MDIPEHRCLVFAAAGQRPAIGGKIDTHDFAAVPSEMFRLLASRHIPEANHLVGATRGQKPTLRRKSQTPNIALIVGEPAEVSSAGDIPQSNLGTPLTCRQGLAIR